MDTLQRRLCNLCMPARVWGPSPPHAWRLVFLFAEILPSNCSIPALVHFTRLARIPLRPLHILRTSLARRQMINCASYSARQRE